MRLILLFSAFLSWALLSAQPTPCKITDMTAEVILFDSVSCEYYVEINFSHMAVTNQFQVFDENGNPLGKFTYGQLPVKVGPFNAGPTPQKRVFVVSDVVIVNCAAEAEADVPGCANDPCGIKMLTVKPDTCTSDSTFSVLINFVHGTALDSFWVWADGVAIGKFGADQLPLWIEDYPWNKGVFSTIKVCADKPALSNTCCQSLQFLVPDCLPFGPCEVYDISVKTGACTSDSTYQITLNFQASNPGLGTFQVWANGEILGVFDLTQVPLQYSAFPASGDSTDVISVCMEQMLTVLCCDTLEFKAPDCSNFGQCQIENLEVTTGPCHDAAPTYSITLDFEAINPSADSFVVTTLTGGILGIYALSDLPVTIAGVPCANTPISKLRVCIPGPTLNAVCCALAEYHTPQCCLGGGACAIENLEVEAGACDSLSATYSITLDFEAINPSADSFVVTTLTGGILGIYALSDLPVTIAGVPCANTPISKLRVCIPGPTLNAVCCALAEYHTPQCCLGGGACEIENLEVEAGACDSLSATYSITLDFEAINPSADSFVVTTLTGGILGIYALSDLPVTIAGVPCANTPISKLRVCIPGPTLNAVCCALAEYHTPQCCLGGGACEIENLEVEAGACDSLSATYSITLDFDAINPSADSFVVTTLTGGILGIYALSDLPVTIAGVPCANTPISKLRVCIPGPTPNAVCCALAEYHTPQCCLGGGACAIENLEVEAGACDSLSATYSITLDFDAINPSADSFVVTTLTGGILGIYALSDLPVTIAGVPCVNTPISKLRVCIPGPTLNAVCCALAEYHTPQCCLGGGACEIENLEVEAGACDSLSATYSITLDFEAINPSADSFVVTTLTGGILGIYALSDLPVTIAGVPCANTPISKLRVCIPGPTPNAVCCALAEYHTPQCCLGGGACEIENLKVTTGPCNSAAPTYSITLDFEAINPSADSFVVTTLTGGILGVYALSDLPVSIAGVPCANTPVSKLRVCIPGPTPNAVCCALAEYPTPQCCFGGPACEIKNLKVTTGPCNNAAPTYSITLDFEAINPSADSFVVTTLNGGILGIYALSDLPVTIAGVPCANTPISKLRVCIPGPTPNAVCCALAEYPTPQCCLGGGACAIKDVTITPGNCYQNSVTYPLTLNFTAVNPTSNTFEVWTGSGMYLGAYQLSQLPVTIPQVLCANNPKLKICIKDNPNCCQTVEYLAPPCCNPSGQCEIVNLKVETGDCTTDSTYQVWINFDVVASSPVYTFHLWANNLYWGEFSLNLLPFQINDFPWGGGATDFVKICLSLDTLGGGAFTCCRTRNFPVPDCIKGGGCEIKNLVAQTGQCTSDSTFEVWINFDYIGVTPNGMFGLWANGQYLGMYALSQLPLYIPNFPWNGDVGQTLKVCAGVSSTNIQCCKTIGFNAPDCIVDECLIWDLQALATPCLCGEFFAILTFRHKNGGAMGYDIIGNGVNYGNFPYGHVQPIILGPFVGDAITEYAFAVRDHLDDACKDDVKLGKIDCTVSLQQPGAQPHSLILSPNPAADWLNVTALIAGGGRPGVSTVEVFHADGRRVMLRTVEDGGSFRLDVSALPAGIYRLSLRTAFGAVDGVFAKQ